MAVMMMMMMMKELCMSELCYGSAWLTVGIARQDLVQGSDDAFSEHLCNSQMPIKVADEAQALPPRRSFIIFGRCIWSVEARVRL